jgi:hypothetical protein
LRVREARAASRTSPFVTTAQDGLSYKPQLKNGWKSMEADPMGQWKGFWNLPGFTQRVKANVDFGGNAAADVSG